MASTAETEPSLCPISFVDEVNGLQPGQLDVKSKMAALETSDILFSPTKNNVSLAQSLLKEERSSLVDAAVQDSQSTLKNKRWTLHNSSDSLHQLDQLLPRSATISSLNRISHNEVSLNITDSVDESFYSCPLISVADSSAPTSPSSCLEEGESYIRLDAMDDTSGTSSEEEDDNGTPRDVSSSFSSSAPGSVFYSPSPSDMGRQSLHARRLAFLATSTPKPVVHHALRYGHQDCHKEKHSMSVDEYSKIRMLAASMPSTVEEQQRIIPVLRGLTPLDQKEAVLFRRQLNENFRSPIGNANAHTIPNLQVRSNRVTTVKSTYKTVNLRDTNRLASFVSPFNDDLSPTILRDFGLRRFDFTAPQPIATSLESSRRSPRSHDLMVPGPAVILPGISRWMPRSELFTVPEEMRYNLSQMIHKTPNKDGCDIRGPRPARRRLDSNFDNSFSNVIAKQTGLLNGRTNDSACPPKSSPNMSPTSQKRTKFRKFRTEDEEAVYYLVMKYLDPREL